MRRCAKLGADGADGRAVNATGTGAACAAVSVVFDHVGHATGLPSFLCFGTECPPTTLSGSAAGSGDLDKQVALDGKCRLDAILDTSLPIFAEGPLANLGELGAHALEEILDDQTTTFAFGDGLTDHFAPIESFSSYSTCSYT